MYFFFPVRHTNERSAGTQGGVEEPRQNHSSTHNKMPTTSAGANGEFVRTNKKKTKTKLFLDLSKRH